MVFLLLPMPLGVDHTHHMQPQLPLAAMVLSELAEYQWSQLVAQTVAAMLDQVDLAM
jgi:hypothetical protein